MAGLFFMAGLYLMAPLRYVAQLLINRDLSCLQQGIPSKHPLFTFHYICLLNKILAFILFEKLGRYVNNLENFSFYFLLNLK